jgi:hypothetical protein
MYCLNKKAIIKKEIVAKIATTATRPSITSIKLKAFITESIQKADKNITKLNIRINYLGDKEFAELIYKKVDEQIDIIEFDPQGNPTKKHFSEIYNQRNF